MRKLFILFGLFLSLSLSGQLLPGIVESQKVSIPAEDCGLLTNCTFNTDLADWVNEGKYTWESDGAGGGRAKHTAAAGGNNQLHYDDILTVGVTYTVTFTVGGSTTGAFYVKCGTAYAVFHVPAANGTFVEDITSDGTFFVFETDDTFDGYVDDFKVVVKP